MSNSNNENLFKRINIDTFIAIVYIIISLMNISANRLRKRYIIYNDSEFNSKARDIYIIVQFVTVVVSAYFLYRNYNDYKNNKNEKELRLIGSILIFIGALLVLISQVDDSDNDEVPII